VKTHERRREKALGSGAYEEGMAQPVLLPAPVSNSTADSALGAQPTLCADSPTSANIPPTGAERYRLGHVPDEALHTGVKKLVGRQNVLTADLLAHLAEVDARGIYRERACSSLYAYCVYELRLSEDEAQRRVTAARTARRFPSLFEMLADGAIHLTGLLLLAPCLTAENQAELLARARFRTKREIERVVAEVAPRPDVVARIQPLAPIRASGTNLWQAYMASLRGAVRELPAGVGRGQAPPAVFEETERIERPSSAGDGGFSESPAPARIDDDATTHAKPLVPFRYRVEFTASQNYVDLLEEARNLLQHQVPDRDIARIHELAMAAFVEHLRKRRQSATRRPRRAAPGERALEQPTSALPSRGSAPERASPPASAPARMATPATRQAPARDEPEAARSRHVPAAIRRAVWLRDAHQCTFVDSNGRRCRERAGLEIHHEHAYALGGSATLENLRLVCRAHNALYAERDFGRAHVERMKGAP
jgi:hypothetical protein